MINTPASAAANAIQEKTGEHWVDCYNKAVEEMEKALAGDKATDKTRYWIWNHPYAESLENADWSYQNFVEKKLLEVFDESERLSNHMLNKDGWMSFLSRRITWLQSLLVTHPYLKEEINSVIGSTENALNNVEYHLPNMHRYALTNHIQKNVIYKFIRTYRRIHEEDSRCDRNFEEELSEEKTWEEWKLYFELLKDELVINFPRLDEDEEYLQDWEDVYNIFA